MASELKDGEPCPVCGSTNHPSLAKIKGEIPTEEELKNAKRLAENESLQAENKSVECAKIKGQIEELKKAILKEIELLFGQVDLLNCDKLIENKLLEIERELVCIDEKIINEINALKEKEEIDKRIPLEESLLQNLREKQIELDKTIVADETTKKEKESQIEKLLKSLKFSSKADAFNFLKELKDNVKLFKETIENAEKEYNEKSVAFTKLQGEISMLEKLVKEVCEIDLEKEYEIKALLTAEKDDVLSKKENINGRIIANKTCLLNIQNTIRESKELEEHYKWMNTLSNTANGGISEKEKISFETYVQMSYFERILRRASIRLQKMTGGQYDLIRRKDELGKRSQVGLDIDVYDYHNGTTRPVNTLSGGEQFKASLALALGLSDEIQSSAGGVRLDTMFIDEGFGSLDGESLSLAISTLQDLTEGNRLVGIISHVEELKNIIDKQIIVEKKRVGGSHATIVNL